MEKMYAKLYNAFANDDMPFGSRPLGNPVVACICDEFPEEKIMEKISIDFSVPIICFLKCDNIKEKKVEIRYYCGNGKEVNLCGHGTFGSTKFIGDYFKLKENDVITYIPHYEKYVYLKNQTICGIIKKNGCSIRFPKLDKRIINDKNVIQRVCDVLGVIQTNVKDVYLSSLDDIILILNNVKEMRRINPDYSVMLKLSEEFKMTELRTIMTSAVSDQDGYDFETRVFAPWIDANEDVACGSANCSLAHYWSGYFDKKIMKMIYPYTVHYNGHVGGVQNIEIYDDMLVNISSDAYLRNTYYIDYERKTGEYFINEINEGI